MDEIKNKVRGTLEEYHMLEPGDRVITAISGGADSVCLLALLNDMKLERGIDIRAVHVHHGLRGQEADRDADFVRVFCAELNVPCHIIRVDVMRYAAKSGLSEEEAGRCLRYEALEQEAQAWEREDGVCERSRVKIAVAHHSGDQAETILHNLFRGSGLGGLKGIPYVRGRIIRPLMDTDRPEIEEWLKSQGLSWVQDSTNSGDHYTRNRIRGRLLPLIEKEVNQGAAGNILRMGKLAAQADQYLQQQAKYWSRGHVRCQRGKTLCFFIPCDELAAEPEIIRSYVVMGVLKNLAGSSRDLMWVHVQQVMELAGRPVGKKVCLPYGIIAVKEYAGLWMGRGGTGEDREEMPLPEVKLRMFPYKKGTEFPKNMYTKWFDCDRIKGTPVVRTRRPGDYITLPDGCHKALKRYMIDEKIPRQLRDQVPLLADGSHVMWIIGYRISEGYKIGPDTVQVLQAEVSQWAGEKNE